MWRQKYLQVVFEHLPADLAVVSGGFGSELPKKLVTRMEDFAAVGGSIFKLEVGRSD